MATFKSDVTNDQRLPIIPGGLEKFNAQSYWCFHSHRAGCKAPCFPWVNLRRVYKLKNRYVIIYTYIHIITYIYIYVYMCICVCVYIYVEKSHLQG